MPRDGRVSFPSLLLSVTALAIVTALAWVLEMTLSFALGALFPSRREGDVAGGVESVVGGKAEGSDEVGFGVSWEASEYLIRFMSPMSIFTFAATSAISAFRLIRLINELNKYCGVSSDDMYY